MIGRLQVAKNVSVLDVTICGRNKVNNVFRIFFLYYQRSPAAGSPRRRPPGEGRLHGDMVGAQGEAAATSEKKRKVQYVTTYEISRQHFSPSLTSFGAKAERGEFLYR